MNGDHLLANYSLGLCTLCGLRADGDRGPPRNRVEHFVRQRTIARSDPIDGGDEFDLPPSMGALRASCAVVLNEVSIRLARGG